MPAVQTSSPDLAFLAAGGETGALIAAYDWAATPLGPIAVWPQSLKTAVGLLLRSPVPIVLLWGEDGVMLYNDAYSAFAGGRHPGLLGSKVREGWPEVADFNDNVMRVGLAGGTLAYCNQELTLHRNGAPEPVWMDLDYSPVPDESGAPAGVLAIVVETTQKVLAERAQAFRLTLEERLRGLSDPVAMMEVATRTLAEHLRVAQVGFGEVDGRQENVTVHRDWNDGRIASVAGTWRMDHFGPAAITEMKAGATIAISDVRADRRTADRQVLAAYEGIATRAVLDVPLLRDGRMVAILFIHHPEPRAWTPAEITLVEETGGRLWAAVERARAEAALRASEARFRLMADAVPQIIWITDPEGRAEFFNRQWTEYTGAAFEPTTAVRVAAEFVHPDDGPLTMAAFDEARRTGGSFRVEHRIRSRSGDYRWFLVRADPHRDSDTGEITRWFGASVDIHARKVAEAKLRWSEERFRALVTAGSYSVYRMSPDWTEMRQLDGRGFLSDTHVPSEGWLADYIHPDDQPRVMAALREAIRTKGMFELEHRVRRADGTLGWMFSRAVPILDADGEIVEWFGAASDVTARKEAEERLRASEEQLRLATDAAEIGLWDLDVGTDALFWPPRVKAMFGIPANRPISMADFYAGLHPDDRDRVAAAFAAALDPDRRSLYDVEYRTVGREDGLVRWVAAKGRAIFDDGGRCVRVIGTAIDVTARKATEERLRELNETLEQRVEERTAERNRVWAMSRDLLAVMGFDGYLKAINPAWQATLGLDEATLLARPFPEQVHPDDHAAVEVAVERLRRGETIARFEDRLRHADGSWRWIAWGLVPEHDVFYAVGRDITAEKEATAELERAQDALRQAQKMEAMGQLTGGIAHDFNNLLGAVVGSLDLIRRKPADVERVRRFAEAGLQAAERGAKLTGQLLAFSRAQRIELKPLVVSDLIASMRDMLAHTLGPLVRLNLRLEEGRTPVLSDPTQLEMAVLNLAINARDAMAGGGDITIATARRIIRTDAELIAGDYIELTVSDMGAGMTPEVAARAFDPFFTTKDVGKGTGLGLSQVYGIARQSGGTVRIESQPGAGTSVRIYLPKIDAQVSPGIEGEADGHVAPAPAATILVIDDDPDMRRVLVDSLDALSYRVIEAVDGSSGLAALDRDAPDLMIVDFAMPGMNGAEVAKAARERRPDLPIVFASGYADTAAIRSVAGPEAPVLRKPFRFDNLQAALANALNRRA